MKKLILLFIPSLCIFNSAYPQSLVKIWDNRFGGNEKEWMYSILQTADGGFILGGQTFSGISGDKTEDIWGGIGVDVDYWIVKTDSVGYILWDKDFGGTAKDGFYTMQQSPDRGFILGGYSYSGVTGDKTQPSWGLTDFWIVKTDSLGIKQWDKDFGGAIDDVLFSLQNTTDGGFILGGFSLSGISGDKTQGTQGVWDYWIVKTDSLGNKIWDKDFGGSDVDYLYSIQQTSDGGFILGGISNSGISGDKSQTCWGGSDYWIIKTDSLGNKLWDKDFGGSGDDRLFSIQQTADGGFILGGLSNSDISGDKTQPTWGDYDYWIVKTDSLGNKQWDKDFGGTNPEDEFGNIIQTINGGYLLTGNSYSQISGNKTETNLGGEQTWVIELDATGNILWDKTIFTDAHDENGFSIQTKDGCFVVANSSSGGIAGYKTQNSWANSYDYWMVKFCETLEAGFTSSSFLCPGTCNDFINLSFGATSYQWYFPGAIPDTSTSSNPANICYANPGIYDVQLIARNSNGSDTLLLSNYITVFPFPPPQGIIQNGDTLFANTGSALYQWYLNGNLIQGATDYFYVADTSGNYNVVATDMNGCEVEAVINNVIANTNQIHYSSEHFEIYPNPVYEEFRVWSSESGETAFETSIYNVMGEKIELPDDRGPDSYREWTVDCRSLPQGIYYLEISSDKKIYRTKFLKQ